MSLIYKQSNVASAGGILNRNAVGGSLPSCVTSSRALLSAHAINNKEKATSLCLALGANRRLFVMFFSFIFFSGLLSAQQGSDAALNGTVRDTSGAIISAAQVVATNIATHVTYGATTTDAGIYTVPSLPPGVYDISAKHDGFSPATIKDVTFHVAQLLTVDLTLHIGGTTETVTVSSDAQLLETSTAQISRIIDNKELNSWPVLASHDGMRDLSEFIYNNLPGTTGQAFEGSINGGQRHSNEVYIDGISLGTFDTSETGPSVDAISELNLQVGSMSAQYNGGGTAVTNFGVKSGTNVLHGSLFSSLQNEDLNANSYAAKQAGIARAEARQSIYSGTVGGPIFLPKLYDGRNKSFFFVNVERDSINNLGIGGVTTLPTQAMLGGDFSAFLNPALTQNAQSGQVVGNDILGRPVIYGQIYNPAQQRILQAGQTDPLTGLTARAAGLVREPFLNNRIAASLFDPVAANYLKLKLPANYINNLVINNVSTLASPQPTFLQHYFTVKLDQVLTSKQKVTFFYTTIYRNRSGSPGNAFAVPGSSVLDTYQYQRNPGKVIRLNHYWEPSPRISNHLGVGYFRFENYFEPEVSAQNWAATLNVQNTASTGFLPVSFSGQPSLAGSTRLLGNSANGNGNTYQNFMGIDQVYISHGVHQFQLGTEARFYRNNIENISTAGTFSFSNTETDDGVASSPYAGNAVASFLLGQVDTTTRTIFSGTQDYERPIVGTYFQDDWKLSPRITMNLGVRWEVVGALTETRGQWAGINLQIPNAAAGNLPGALQFAGQLGKKGFENTDWGIVLPRFGITYNPTARIVGRAGLGVNTQAPEGNPYLGTGEPSSQGYSRPIIINRTTNPQPFPDMAVSTLSSLYTSFSGVLPSFDPTQLNLQNGSVNNPKGARSPYVINYNAGLQLDLGHKTIAEINYVGNTSRRLNSDGLSQLNQLPIGDLSTYGDALLDNISLHPGIPAPYPGFHGTVQQALAPIPQYAGGGVTLFASHLGWSRYDALQATITRRAGTGLSILAAYTWAKTLTNTNGGIQDVYNLKAEKAVASFLDVPQQFKLTFTYDLPFGRGRRYALHGVADWVAGGWLITGNGIYQSGDTLSITDSLVRNGIFAVTRPNYTGVPVELNRKGFINTVAGTGPLYLNPAAFTHVAYTSNNHVALAVGNVPSVLPNVLGPGLAYENLGLQKSFTLGGDRALSFRADAFNAFNRAGRGDPVTDINNPNFGLILQTNQGVNGSFTPRIVQVQAHLNF